MESTRSPVQLSMTEGRLRVLRIVSLKFWSTRRNCTVSLGSCFWMSGALKMLSRYIHERCTVSHSSSVSDTSASLRSHVSTCSRMPDTKREASIVCSPAWLSSSWAKTSSRPPSTKTSLLSRYGFTTNDRSFHAFSIFSSWTSSAYSPLATPDTSSTTSLYRKISQSMRSDSVMSAWYGRPRASKIRSKCRFLMALLPRATRVGA
mmetsp:Transcript_5337/g.17249  ORF Transcript_5337/g.17249 Transcript_5337/m.17249 type:complete len:205 (-) Transcript_5337:2553-3167(-)